MSADELRSLILAAFAQVPKPALAQLAPHRCCECDDLAAALHPHTATGLPPYLLQRHVWDLPLLSDEGKHYYLPAWLLDALRDDESSATDAVLYALDADHRWSPDPPYTGEQWLAIDTWLAWVAAHVDASLQEDIQRVREKLPR